MGGGLDPPPGGELLGLGDADLEGVGLGDADLEGLAVGDADLDGVAEADGLPTDPVHATPLRLKLVGVGLADPFQDPLNPKLAVPLVAIVAL
jgi:hypothetical protein